MVFNVGMSLRWVAACERTQLRRRHAHGAAALDSILTPYHGFPPQAGSNAVQRFHPMHLEHRAYLQLVLPIGAPPRSVGPTPYTVPLQPHTRPESRSLPPQGLTY